MQPYTAEFARSHLTPMSQPIVIEGNRYEVELSGTNGFVREFGGDKAKAYARKGMLELLTAWGAQHALTQFRELGPEISVLEFTVPDKKTRRIFIQAVDADKEPEGPAYVNHG